jgi:hypothetical protein
MRVHWVVYRLLRKSEENPGCVRGIQGARGESRMREENPGCARGIQGARGESRVREENPCRVHCRQLQTQISILIVVSLICHLGYQTGP